MSGLEAIEVKEGEIKNNKDARIDSAFYTTQLKKNHSLKYEKIGRCLNDSQYGISISMNEEKKGYPIYRMNEIHNMLCDLNVDKYAVILPEEFYTFKLNKGDVLFNRTNSYEWVGRTGVYYPNSELTPMIFASYLVRFVPNNKINSEYLAAFLSCKYGVNEVKRRARQSINQTNVNPEEVKEIEIPLLKNEIQKIIKNCFIKAHNLRIKADKTYTTAENRLLSALGMENFTPSTESVAIKLLSESYDASGRLDAEYYQKKYDDLFLLLSKKKCVQLKDIGDFKNGSLIPDTLYTTNGKRAYIRIKELSFNQPINLADIIYITDDFVATNETIVRKNDFVIATIGNTIGKVNLIPDNLDNSFISNNTTRFRLKDTKAYHYYYELLLRSIIVQEQIQKEFTQTAQPKIGNDSLENIIIPILDTNIQKQIADDIQKSFELRKKSEQLLESAKRAVEIAIEEGEEAAMVWLEEKS